MPQPPPPPPSPLPLQTLLHPDAHPDGGYGLTDRALLDSQRAAIFDLVKDLGRALLTGSLNLTAVSLPVKMFEPRSYLQKLTDTWTHPRFLAAAAATPDPVERLKLVVIWFVAGLQHVYQSWRKPFNPILGETWGGALADGSVIYMEQVSHHPPVSAFELVGPARAYTFRGLSQPDVSFKGTDVRTTAKGARSLEFADGVLGRIHVTFPHYYMRGVVGTGMPRGEMCGAATFTAPGAGLGAEVVFGRSRDARDAGDALLQRPDAVTGAVFRLAPESAAPASSSARGGGAAGGGSFGSMLAALSSTDDAPPPRPPADTLAVLKGNWLSHADWDCVRYWTLAADVADVWRPLPAAAALPSDAARRADLAAMAAAAAGDAGGVARAQIAKEALERAQRADAKARKEGRAAVAGG